VSVIIASRRARRAAGTLFLALLAGAAAAALLSSGRTLGRGIRFDVQMASPGALHPDGKVKVAGREVGEVRGMRWEGTGGERHVLIDCFVQRDWAESVRENSDVFVTSPNLLGESWLEVGPPRGGAEPGPPVKDGARLVGVDPPEFDKLIGHVYTNLTAIVILLKEQRPALDELLRAGSEMLATLSGLPADPGQLGRIRDQVGRGIDDGRALAHALNEANAVPEIRKLAKDLSDTADRVGPDLADVARRAALAAERLDKLRDLFSDERRAQVAHALASFRRVAEIGDGIVKQVKWLIARVERGEGTVGGFFVDQELYDDLHETHRILKSQPWTLIVKPPKGEKTIAH
jgi:ABC-type transporter Mla subunit MlaD